MLKKTITYNDYNGVSRTEDFYFNLTQTECIELETSVEGGLSETIKSMYQKQEASKIFPLFKKLIMLSYGEKTPDGKRFVKSEKLSEEFSQTPAYDSLFIDLISDTQHIIDFVNGIIPGDINVSDVMNEAEDKVVAMQTTTEA